jgi:hydroxymethylpyrimidine/phosphomethylpyrimidine kinase
VLLQGGHPNGPVLPYLLLEGDSVMRWAGERIDTPNTHGTGCTLSSAIACGLARALPLADAVAQARDYVRAALHASAQWRLGRGHGPLNHGFSPLPTTGHAQER